MAQLHEYQRSRLLESSKLALLQYNADVKPSSSHNYNQRSLFWDREHIYNENLMLRNKLKQMEQINTKTRTRLLRSQKEAAEIVSLTKGKRGLNILRSISTQHLKPEAQINLLKWNVDALKEEEHAKKILFMKKQIRQLKEQVQKMKNQNIELKKTMKYTRMNEMQAENQELMQEILRLNKLVSENNRQKDQMLMIFAKEKQDYRLNLRKEIEDQAHLKKELKKAKQSINHLKDQQSNGNKWVAQIKRLQFQNLRLREQLKISYSSTLQPQPFKFKKRQEISNPQNFTAQVTQTVSTEILQKSLPPYKPEPEEFTSLQQISKHNKSAEILARNKPRKKSKTPPEHEAIFEVPIEESRSFQSENRPQSSDNMKSGTNFTTFGQKVGEEAQAIKEQPNSREALPNEKQKQPMEKDTIQTNNETPVATIKKKSAKDNNPGQLLQQIYQNDEEEFQNLMEQQIVQA